jgi:hypothetical protein
MTDLSQALAEISAIRAQVARDTQFRGYGPASIAVSGVLALLVAAAESHWSVEIGAGPLRFLAIWAGTAAVAVTLTAGETIIRARRVHSGFASAMIQTAVEQFFPALVVGVLLTVVLLRVAAEQLWMLPGLWELIFSLGVFASCRFLPRQMFAVGVWYLACGLTCLMAGSSKALSPWEMGIPFGVGQLLVAVVLQYCFEESVED